MQVNIIITIRDFPKVVFKKKTVISDSYIKEDLVHANYYRRTRLVTRSTCKTHLVTDKNRLTTRSTRSTRLFTRSTHFSTRSTRVSTRSTHLSIRLSIRSTRLSTRRTHLPTRSICLSTHSTCSTIYRSFYNSSWLSLNFKTSCCN